jgi:hypothetical protein
MQVLEPHFGAELFSTLLSIPASKTLLRRHLSTHFVSLIGNQTQQRKRMAEAEPDYVPLTPNQRVKVGSFVYSNAKLVIFITYHWVTLIGFVWRGLYKMTMCIIESAVEEVDICIRKA